MSRSVAVFLPAALMVAVPVQAGSWFVGGAAGLSVSDQSFVDHPRSSLFEENFYELGRAPLFGAQVLYEPRKLLYVLADVSLGPSYDMSVVSCNRSRPVDSRCNDAEERGRTIWQADLGAGVSWTGGAVNLQAGGGLGAGFFREIDRPGDEVDELDVRQALNARVAASVVTGRLRLGAEGRFVRIGNPPPLSPEPLHLWQARLAVMVRVSD